MGWNEIEFTANGLSALIQQPYFYFVHSYYVPVNSFTIAKCNYTVPFSAMMKKIISWRFSFIPKNLPLEEKPCCVTFLKHAEYAYENENHTGY